ncbi:hypothetical protein SAMN04489712_103519 [Thermomonospora echinospora]|uniref:Dehydratase n=1 Tax=Thermomonospora echinospora TaxID=1992 RepID=A0A1H5Y2A9_9ACTN|nr:hypothetical protein [Thermomonospora echinospora]SEG18038.1 hypothetical protein SAMN04489712_103519 [Thermomonospora echinospora]
MSRSSVSPKVRRAGACAAAGVLAAVGLVAGSGTAHAAEPFRVDYPVNGSTYIKTTDSTMKLGPGKLKVALDFDTGAFTADLALPPAQGSFKEFGVIPVSVTTEFIQEGQTTGAVDLITGATKSTSKVTLRLKNLKVAGIPTPVGDHCKTEKPATINLTSGEGFDVLNGGPMSGTYEIPKFENCLLATPLINLTVPGAGNTINLTLSPAELPSES